MCGAPSGVRPAFHLRERVTAELGRAHAGDVTRIVPQTPLEEIPTEKVFRRATPLIDSFSKMIAARLVNDRGYHAIQALPGVGPILAAILVAEIGDVTRFTRAAQLCSWAGMTPRHRESDTKVHRGRITKQGSRLVRWACIEAVQRVHGGPLLGMRARLVETRGKGIAKVACARELLTLVFYGLRDGQIRCLANQPAKEPA